VPPRGQYSNRGPQPLLLQRDQRQATQLQGILFREPAKPGDKRKSVFADKEAGPKGFDDRQGPRLRHYVSEDLSRGRHTIFGHAEPKRDSRIYAREGPKPSMDVPPREDSRRDSNVHRRLSDVRRRNDLPRPTNRHHDHWEPGLPGGAYIDDEEEQRLRRRRYAGQLQHEAEQRHEDPRRLEDERGY